LTTLLDTRLHALRAQMAAAAVDLVALGPTANMRYIAGYASHPDERLCLVLVTQDDVKAVVPALNADDWNAHVAIAPLTWRDADGPADALAAALAGLPEVRRLAVDGSMRADFLLPLLAATQPKDTIAAVSLIAPVRARKSPEEVAALSRAAAQADRAMAAGVAACRPGVAETEIAAVVEEAFRRDGADKVTFTIVASGPNGAFPHHHSGSRRLQRGDAVILDIGATLDDYQSDITRTVFLGEPPAEFRRVYDAVLAANEGARNAVAPGVPAQEVDRAARSTLEAAGLGEYFVHRTGHGIGLEGHEPPWIMAGNPQALEEGMAFSVEPGVYLPGRFGVRIEDIVVVTAAGVRTLTGYDHGLVVVE
jgi:Xaa-Pro aminopeptidase